MIQEVPAPAITFCASDTNSPIAKDWKNATADSVGSRLETNILWFNLNPKLSYDVVIHDPKFYIYSLTPSAVPQIKIKKKPLKEARNFDLIYITMTKHIKINRSEFPCNDSEDYNFKRCVKESVAEKIGCRMDWDLDSDQSWPVCTSTDQLRYGLGCIVIIWGN